MFDLEKTLNNIERQCDVDRGVLDDDGFARLDTIDFNVPKLISCIRKINKIPLQKEEGWSWDECLEEIDRIIKEEMG